MNPIILIVGLSVTALLLQVFWSSVASGVVNNKGASFTFDSSPFMWSFVTGTILSFSLFAFVTSFGMSGYQFAPMNWLLKSISQVSNKNPSGAESLIQAIIGFLILSGLNSSIAFYSRIAYLRTKSN